MAIDYRKSPGRPGRDEPPAPVVRVQLDLPKAMLERAMAIAKARGLKRQAAVREALAEWIERHEKAPEAGA